MRKYRATERGLKMKRVVGSLAAACLLATGIGCAEGLGFADIDTDIEDTLVFDESARGVEIIDLETHNGAIRLTGGSSREVEIVATRTVRATDEQKARAFADRVRVEVRRDGATLVIRTIRPRHTPSDVEGVSVAYDVQLPADIECRVQTANGAVDIVAMHADVDAETHNGAVTLIDIDGAARAATHNGGISLDDVLGDVTVRTHNGAVSARYGAVASRARIESHNGAVDFAVDGDVRGAVSLHTNNGRISARVGALRGDLNVDTSNGPVDLRVDDVLAGDIDARTSHGSLRLRVPPDAGFRLEATSRRGSIDTPWGAGDGHLDTRVNGDGRSVKLRTSSGSVRVTDR
ncbi:hypothetical protein CMK11_22160 [Candidatus Poribacteria bacterium]|nr:hypothetical protein [Candidatus Poribacteria bacterium]